MRLRGHGGFGEKKEERYEVPFFNKEKGNIAKRLTKFVSYPRKRETECEMPTSSISLSTMLS
jgi:hypothetical protein